MKLRDFTKYFIAELSGIYPESESRSMLKIIMERAFDKTWTQIIAFDPELSADDLEYLNVILTRLKAHEPVQYILSETEFYGIGLYLTPDVLIPRPETEELVDWILKENTTDKPLRILDIGTGSGCIPIALKKNRLIWEISAMDISERTLFIAEENAIYNEAPVHFIIGDILHSDFFKHLPEFDIIVSNPPYIPMKEKNMMARNVLDHEPHLALFVEDDNPLIFYKAIALFAKEHLAENGKLYFELNEFYAKEISDMVLEMGFSKVETRKDMMGKSRMLRAAF